MGDINITPVATFWRLPGLLRATVPFKELLQLVPRAALAELIKKHASPPARSRISNVRFRPPRSPPTSSSAMLAILCCFAVVSYLESRWFGGG